MSFLIDYSYCYNVMLHLLFITTNMSCFIGYSYANSISSSIGLNILMLPVSCFIGFHSYHCVMLCWLFTSITVSCSIDYSQLLMCHAPLVIHMLQCFILHWLFSFYQFHASFVIHSYYCVMLHWLFTATTVSCYIEYSHVTTKLCFVGYSYATRVMLHWLFACYHFHAPLVFHSYHCFMLYWVFTCCH